MDVSTCGKGSALPPACGEFTDVLILGSYPSPISLEKRQYYANPKNQFWAVMEAIFSIPAAIPYQARLEQLVGNGIALWDLIGYCERKGAGDNAIRNARLNDFRAFVKIHPGISLIVANGRTAGYFFQKKYPDGLPGILFHILPSTSPAHAGMSLEEKILAWKIIRKNNRDTPE